MAHSKPRVVVGLDFGTTFSGFAFAHITDPEKVYTFFDYPKAGGAEKPYCKTVTGIYYKNVGPGKWQFKSWGYPARAEYARDIQAMRKQRLSGPSNDPLQPSVGAYVTRFKLHLASKDMGASSAQGLPQGLTVEMLITDYVREMGTLILKTLQDHYGAQLTKRSIQWCVTVPSIWDNGAKAMMKTCMTAAGLVNGVDGSPHPLIIVLEPEAASFFCHKSMSEQALRVGDKLLVADIGGGTSDIVVQEVVSVGKNSYRVKEVTTSSGGLCGGTYIDQRFMEFLHRTIGPCLQECITQQLNVYSQLIQAWEHRKTSFGDRSTIGDSTDINLPNRVVTEWEKYDRRMGKPERYSYDDLEISYQEMQSIFDPVIEQNMQLISHQLAQVRGGVKVLVVVGGFAGSPYLMDCIRKRFSPLVPQIISPPNPGSAVCQGAVLLALNPDTVVSRVCKKTYGIESNPDFDKKLDSRQYKVDVHGVAKCSKRFEIYVRKGDKVDVNSCISRTFTPLHRGQREIKVQLFSSYETDPRYTVGEGVHKEGEIDIDISSDMKLDTKREVKVSLFFGGSSMEIKAEAVNFSAGGHRKLELPVEVGFC
ncbi:hypothetical protein KC19_7G071100 [Ceratodon purpureus]|uniref:Uncharacterized protein n=1 Tax=Ceratodon purpureus TaxID=3225 RepID=A0A8T0H5L8_CERPU|nr:hypothetical protein KC19_7G071100 [Ceratodon purpureus]